MIFVCINTPGLKESYGLDTTNLEKCIKQLGEHYNQEKQNKKITIIIKSTVPVHTCEKLSGMLQHCLSTHPTNYDYFQFISNPEFLAEGQALEDLRYPS